MRLDPRHARDVMNLGLGALLHDIGKIQLPAELRDEQFSPDQARRRPSGRPTPTKGFEMIRGKLEPSASQVALHHHQRWDGEGFPAVDSVRQAAGGRADPRVHPHRDHGRPVRAAAFAGQRPGAAAGRGDDAARYPKFRGLFDPVVYWHDPSGSGDSGT